MIDIHKDTRYREASHSAASRFALLCEHDVEEHKATHRRLDLGYTALAQPGAEAQLRREFVS